MNHPEPVWPPAPTNQNSPVATKPLIIVSPVSKRWGWASLCLLALAILLFYLVDFHRIFDGHYHEDYWQMRFLAEITWDSLLFLAYITGRLGCKTPMGIIGAGFGLPLLLVDMLILMPFAVKELAHYSP